MKTERRSLRLSKIPRKSAFELIGGKRKRKLKQTKPKNHKPVIVKVKRILGEISPWAIFGKVISITYPEPKKVRKSSFASTSDQISNSLKMPKLEEIENKLKPIDLTENELNAVLMLNVLSKSSN